jgi:ketosteroid isomerase-like protein
MRITRTKMELLEENARLLKDCARLSKRVYELETEVGLAKSAGIMEGTRRAKEYGR